MTAAQTAVSTWTIDPVHSSVGFTVRHLALTTFKGRFHTVTGVVEIDEANPRRSSVNAAVEIASIDIRGERLAGHVNSEQFFDAANHPQMTFRSTGVAPIDDRHWQIAGDLTIRGTARPVVLETEYLGQAKHPFSGKTVAGFRAETSINRVDFGLAWNVPMDTGAQYVGEEVRISLEIEAVRQD